MDIDLVTNLGRYQGFQEKIKRLPPGEGWLLVEFGGDSQEESDAKAHKLINVFVGAGSPARDHGQGTASTFPVLSQWFIPGQRTFGRYARTFWPPPLLFPASMIGTRDGRTLRFPPTV